MSVTCEIYNVSGTKIKEYTNTTFRYSTFFTGSNNFTYMFGRKTDNISDESFTVVFKSNNIILNEFCLTSYNVGTDNNGKEYITNTYLESTDRIVKVVFEYGIDNIPKNCFLGCTKLREIIIGISESNINKYTPNILITNQTAPEPFNNLSFSMNKPLTKLSDYCFKGCSGLTKIIVNDPTKLASIGTNVLLGANSSIQFNFYIRDDYGTNSETQYLSSINNLWQQLSSISRSNTGTSNSDIAKIIRPSNYVRVCLQKNLQGPIYYYFSDAIDNIFNCYNSSYIDNNMSNSLTNNSLIVKNTNITYRPINEDYNAEPTILDDITYKKYYTLVGDSSNTRHEFTNFTYDPNNIVAKYIREKTIISKRKGTINEYGTNAQLEILNPFNSSPGYFRANIEITEKVTTSFNVTGLPDFSNNYLHNDASGGTISALLRDTSNNIYHKNDVISLFIPTKIKNIPHGFLYNYTNLHTVNIPTDSNYTTLNSIFSDNNGLTSIIIPPNVKALDDKCFNNCRNLTSLSLVGITSIGDYCFNGCTNLKDISIIFSDASNFPVPSDINKLKLTIGNYCFKGCINLTSITIRGYAISLEDACFSGCINLETVNLTGSILLNIGHYTFKNCSKLIYGTLMHANPFGSLSSFGISCFEGCNNFTDFNIPNNIQTLNIKCFSNCINLTSITIDSSSNSLQYINDYCFYGCNNIKHIFSNNDGIYVLPNLLYIGKSAFEGCSSINKVTYLNNTTSYLNIPEDCFKNCTNITSVLTKTGVTIYTEKLPDNIIDLGNFCFANCSSLTKITSSSIVSIGFGSFLNCINLAMCSLGNNVEQINDMAFYNCRSLSFTITNNIKSIGNFCFSGCNNATEYTIPTSIRSLGLWCFSAALPQTNDLNNPLIDSSNNNLSNLRKFIINVNDSTSSLNVTTSSITKSANSTIKKYSLFAGNYNAIDIRFVDTTNRLFVGISNSLRNGNVDRFNDCAECVKIKQNIRDVYFDASGFTMSYFGKNQLQPA